MGDDAKGGKTGKLRVGRWQVHALEGVLDLGTESTQKDEMQSQTRLLERLALGAGKLGTLANVFQVLAQAAKLGVIGSVHNEVG